MTLDLIRKEIWAMIGEPTDLDPSSDTQYGGNPLLDWVVNEGQRQVAMWQDPVTRGKLRIQSLISETYFQNVYITGTLTDDAGTATIIFPAADVGAQNDRYNTWTATVNGETKIIVGYVGGTLTATVHEDWSTLPVTGDTYELRKRFYIMVPSTHSWASENLVLPAQSDIYRAEGNLVEVLNVEDLERRSRLERGGSTTAFIEDIFSDGDPGEWIRYGNRIIFDRSPSDTRWYRMEYYRLPTTMAGTAPTTEIPEIPEMFHYGIALWGIEWGFRRSQDTNAKFSTKRDFVDFMRRTKSQYDIQFERHGDWGSVIFDDSSTS